MVFADGVRHHDLVVELYVAELRMCLRAVDVAVEEHHEVRRYLVDVGRVFRHYGNLVVDVYRNRCQELVVTAFFRYLVPYFIVQIVQPVRLTLIPRPVDDDHRHLVLRLVVRVLHRLENARTLPEHARHVEKRLLSSVVRALYFYIAEEFFE